MPKFVRKLTRARNCPLCASDTRVDYKDVPLLKKYVSDRGKIMGRAKSGVCARHQRQITRGIKRARYVALLPFTQG